MRPVCAPCGREMRCEKNGQGVVTHSDPERRHPYQLLVGDKWRCGGCGGEVVIGFAARPVSEHWRDDFEQKRALFPDAIEVVP